MFELRVARKDTERSHSHLHIQWFAKGTCRTTMIEIYNRIGQQKRHFTGSLEESTNRLSTCVQCLCPEKLVGDSKSKDFTEG